MKEIELSEMSEPEKIRYNSRTLERLDSFANLDTESPYIWHAADKVLNTQGEQVGLLKQDYILQPATLRKLKGVAIASEFSLAKSQGNQELAHFILNPPKLNPLRNKDGGVR